MTSNAYQSLLFGIEEVRHLQQANPTPRGGLPQRPNVIRAINRASVVLLCSHLERYLRALNEEAIEATNRSPIPNVGIPIGVKLLHSRTAIDEIAERQWDNRRDVLERFVETDGWLWGTVQRSDLDHERLLQWMKSLSPGRALRMFAMWGVPDVFSQITRQPHTRSRMWLRLQELVDKRNDIAHGQVSAQATYQDIRGYITEVRLFCERVDRVLSRALAQHLNGLRPW